MAGQLLVILAEEVTPTDFLRDPVVQRTLRRFPLEHITPLYPTLGNARQTFHAAVDRIRQQFPIRAQRALPADVTALERMTRTYKLMFRDRTVPLQQLIGELRKSRAVAVVEPNARVRLRLVSDDPYYQSAGSWGQGFDDLWNIKQIAVEPVWDMTQGAGVTVAVIDTGVDYTHPDIAQNIFTNTVELNGAAGIDDDANGYIDDVYGADCGLAGWSEISICSGDPMDFHGHGSHVAGIIAATGNNSIGVVGVAPQATLLPIKASVGGTPNLDAVEVGILYAIEMGADVISMSLSSTGASTLHDVIQLAAQMGVVLVAGTGNEGADTATVYPAAYREVIAVGADGPLGRALSFSNGGWLVDVVAPGGREWVLPLAWYQAKWGGAYPADWNILSLRTSHLSEDIPLGAVVPKATGSYLRLAGTSMAAPHVAGLAALLLAQYPTATVDQVRQAIRLGADDVTQREFYEEFIGDSGTGWDVYSGYGQINGMSSAQAMPNRCVGVIQSPLPNALIWRKDGWLLQYQVGRGTSFSNAKAVSYQLHYGQGAAPSQWQTLTSGQGLVKPVETIVQTLQLEKAEGPYTITLDVYIDNQLCATDRVTFQISKRQWDAVVTDADSTRVFGESLAAADLNGDGVPELFIGAARGNGLLELGLKNKPVGRVYVLPVPKDLLGPIAIGGALNVLILEGESNGAGAGVAAGGDIDGDQIPDLLISDPHYQCPDDSYCGKVYLLLGKNLQPLMAQPPMPPIAIATIAAHAWTGDTAHPSIGGKLSWIADLEGDQLSEIAFKAGKNIALIFSSQLGTSLNLALPDTYPLTGDFSVSMADAPVDGLPRLYVGGAWNELSAWQFQGVGKPFAPLWDYNGPTFPFPGFGTQLVGNCDWNGDGMKDLGVQAGGPETFMYGEWPSSTSLFTGALLTQSGAPDAATIVLQGIPASTNGALWAPVVACAGDYTQDGYDDLVELYSDLSSEEGPLSQVLFLVPGNAAMTATDGGPHVHAATFWRGPNPKQQQWGPPAVTTADLNVDGHVDLIASFSTAPGQVAIAYGQAGSADQGVLSVAGNPVCLGKGNTTSTCATPQFNWQQLLAPFNKWPFH